MMKSKDTRIEILKQIRMGGLTIEAGAQLLKEKKFSNQLNISGTNVETSRNRSDRIAIIGMSGRFAGAENTGEFWKNLSNGVDSITEIPEYRWNKETTFDPTPGIPQKTYCKYGGFIEGIDKFDPWFFNISPREAELMDPQQRLFLQEAWKALEDAGYSPQALANTKCGVFVGCSSGDYQEQFLEKNINPSSYTFMGNAVSILSSRISYFLDLKGPSITIDTACSSTLTAINLGCESIWQGTSDMALAGGVALQVTPKFHILAGSTQMLSFSGRCRTFDDKADGFVPGEGVGIIVLKPLSAALRDKDHIYAVIIGIGLNQDGKTNGITAPNATSQTALELEIYRKYRIDPGTIGYVEAHGTATKLGDPIEIQALSDAFREFTSKKQYCAIGSVKTNIGHTLAAAGAASMIKVLLSFKHKQIPPSLHYQIKNRHIDFDNSPFFVSTRLIPWEGINKQLLRAAVSSFGFSGTNAHIVLEQPPEEAQANLPNTTITNPNPRPYFFIPFSAKTADSLKQKYKDLKDWLIENPEVNISDIAYTFLIGRTHFLLREALVVKNVKDLLSMLREVLENGNTDNILKAEYQVEDSEQSEELNPESKILIKKIQEFQNQNSMQYRKDLMKLAAIYVKSLDHQLDWLNMYSEASKKSLRRLSLPTYPFEIGSYWLPENNRNELTTISSPFNTFSLMSGQQIREMDRKNGEVTFTKQFSGKEFFLEDHIHTLPAVVYLEIVRAIGEQVNQFAYVKRFRKVVWSNPLIVKNKNVNIEIRLKNLKKEWVEFQIYTNQVTEASVKEKSNIIHSRGIFQYGWSSIQAIDKEIKQKFHTIDIQNLLKRCRGGKEEAESFYRRLENNNSYLGPRFKSLKEFYFNQKEALAKVGIDVQLEGDINQFHLHPALTDSALQCMAAFGYMTGFRQDRVFVPFVLEEMEIVESFENQNDLNNRICYTYVIPSENKTDLRENSSSRKTFDALLLDQNGHIKIKMKGFSFRPFAPSDKTLTMDEDVIYYRPFWEKSQQQPFIKDTIQPQNREKETISPLHQCHPYLLLFDTYSGLKEKLKAKYTVIMVKPGKRFLALDKYSYEINLKNPEDYHQLMDNLHHHRIYPEKVLHFLSKEAFSIEEKQIALQMEQGIYSLFFLTQAFLKRKKSEKISIPIYYFFNSESAKVHPIYGAVEGFIHSIVRESREIVLHTISLENDIFSEKTENQSDLLDIILVELDYTEEFGVKYEGGIRYLKRLQEYIPIKETGDMQEVFQTTTSTKLLKDKGVYIITGGLGALGIRFARYLAEKIKTRIVLTDLKEPNEQVRQIISEIEQQGSEVLFYKTNISIFSEVEDLFKKIVSQYGKVNGIIHTAGVIRDSFLQDKTLEEMQTVILPKVHGTILLDEVSKSHPLDFFVMFSSLTALLGSPGQCDYGYANSFMDHYAEFRTLLHKQGERPGKTLSINWPYWKNGGMKLDERIEKLLKNELGIKPLEDETGIQIFQILLEQPNHHVGIVQGNHEKVISTLNLIPSSLPLRINKIDSSIPKSNSNSPKQASKYENSEKEFSKELIEMVSNLLKIPKHKITLQGNISNYGFDSISFTELSAILNKRYRLGVTPDVFFEHSNLESIIHFLMDRYQDKIFSSENLQELPSEKTVEVNYLKEDQYEENKEYSEDIDFNDISEDEIETHLVNGEPKYEAIAIIGMSGVMPQSSDLDEFWPNIQNNKDLIGEIPIDRWDWQEIIQQTGVKWGAFMKDAGKFDSLFFNISPREAELMDPQLRIFLEVVWHTLEDAGYKTSQLAGSDTSVFVGVSTMDYKRVLEDSAKLGSEQLPFMVANRVSYFFDWHGPSESVDTACSSSLVALHRAIESLQNGTSQLAIAGGVSVIADPLLFINEANSGMLSPDGRCYTFDKRANGYVRGEGVGAILLKPLNKALADNDHIYGIIRGSAVNHSGHTNSPTTPNPSAQAEVIISAIERAGLHPAAINYIEAHGTATNLGDPIEFNGLKKAFEQIYKKWNESLPNIKFCGVGTVKTKIGHLEAAAGIAGIINVLLAMKHKTLIGDCHFQELSPYIHLEETPFYIVKESIPWKPPRDERGNLLPRCAGISSFGIGGTNAHVILEENNYNHPKAIGKYQMHPQESTQNQNHLFLLSARNEERLIQYTQNILNYLKIYGTESLFPTLEDIVYTFQVGRESMEERLAVIVNSKKELELKLRQYHQKNNEIDIENLYSGNIKKQKSRLLVEDEEGKTFIRMVIERGKLEKLAQLWVSGVEIDWNLLYIDKRPRRQSLPKYPFAPKRHWATKPSLKLKVNTQPSPPNIESPNQKSMHKSVNCQDMEKELEYFLYVPIWKTIKPKIMGKVENPANHQEIKEEKRVILVIYPPQKSGFEVPETITNTIVSLHKGHLINRIYWGNKTKKRGKHTWEIKAGDPSAWDKLLGYFKQLHTIYFIDGIMGMTKILPKNHNDRKIVQDIQHSLLSIFRLIKALNLYELNRYPIQLKIITNGVYQIYPGENINPYPSPLHGLARVISRENPHFAIQSIDISFRKVDSFSSDLEIKELSTAISVGFPLKGYQELAIREKLCYTRAIEPLILEKSRHSSIKANGIYWIVGGAGKIGLQLSKYFIKTLQAKVVISGRTKLNPEIEEIIRVNNWDEKLLYLQADVTDLESMKQAIHKIKDTFSKIDGVIHAAVNVKNKALENMDEKFFLEGLAPKVEGSMILKHVLEDESLDFLVFFSSVQSFIGEPGMGNYVAANVFEDVYAHYIAQQVGYPVKTINWGYWGIESNIVNKTASRSVIQQGLKPFSPALGIESLLRILQIKQTQVIPLKAESNLLLKLGLSPEILKERENTENHTESNKSDTSSSLLNLEKQPRLDKQIWLNLGEAHNRLEEFSHFILLDIFQQMGVFRVPHQQYYLESLKSQLKIIPEYYRLFNVLIEILIKIGFININQDDNNRQYIVTTKTLTEEGVQKRVRQLPSEKDQLLKDYPDIKASIHLLWSCYQKYPEIITGKIPAAEVLFPNSSMELMEGLYKGNVEADYYNRLVLFAFESTMLATLPPLKENQQLKILEIGAGTGGTSAPLFESIQRNNYTQKVHYVYTDISHAFARYGKEHYGKLNSNAEFKVLDIEKDIRSQGYTPGDFDVIIAANVLHATRLMHNTLSNVQLLLKSGGRIILNEGTKNRDYGSIMFGLLEGWWLYQDEENRLPGCPMLTTATWERILQKHGFQNVTIIGEPDVGNMTGMQHIITARMEKPGNIEYKLIKSEPFSSPAMSLSSPILSFETPSNIDVDNDTLPQRVEAIITKILAAVLQIEKAELDIDMPYTDMGVDSILAIEIVNKINEMLGLHLRSTDLFNYTSVNKLTKYILKEQRKNLILPEIKTSQPSPIIKEDTTKSTQKAPTPSTPSIIQQGEQGSYEQSNIPYPRLKIKHHENNTPWVDIAVIGISGRFPDALNTDELWKNIISGKNSIREINRWKPETYFDPDPKKPDKSYCKWGGLLSEIDTFDPLFFNISPKEAELMDPQQRLFLEEAWKALEDAGYSGVDLDEKKCGVFVGFNASDYRKIIEDSGILPDAYTMTGNYEAMLSARISYFLNLRGPAVTINTACSASLTAVHLACESICCGTSDMAIAGGVGIMNSPALYILLSRTEVLSFNGQCRAFNKDADGIVLGEGVGAVVLKRLDLALENRDNIYGVIIGSGLNQDGRSNGITAPNGPAQTALECEIYDKYKINPETITYLEAHGTGTRLGDPMEVEALTDAFKKYTSKKQFCAIGSIKSNIGHLGAAAGVTGLIKMLLSLKYKKLVPSLFAENPNPLIDFENSPFYINTTIQDWEAKGIPRTGAVSSFGFSGTNSHLVIRELEQPSNQFFSNKNQTPENLKPWYLFPLSAKTKSALKQKLKDFSEWLDNSDKSQLMKDISYTLLQGRSHFQFRLVFMVESMMKQSQLLTKIRNLMSGERISNYIDNLNLPDHHVSKPKLDPVLKRKGEETIQIINTNNLTSEKYKEKLQILADLFIKGYNLDWNLLYEGENCCRISLPTYPFARENYWVTHPEISLEQHNLEIKTIMKKLEDREITLNEAKDILEEKI